MYFRSVILLINLLAIAVHAMLGCCMHHRHQTCDRHRSSVFQAPVHSCQDGHTHQLAEFLPEDSEGGLNVDPGSDQHHASHCEHTDCQYLSMEKVDWQPCVLSYFQAVECRCGCLTMAANDDFHHLVSEKKPVLWGEVCAWQQVWRL